MKPVDQSIFKAPGGDCMAACVASILELPLEAVPNPQSDEWYKEWDAFLLPLNLRLIYFRPQEEGWAPPGYSILAGKSPRGDWDHAVVCYDGRIVHDPYPGRAGVTSVVDYAVFMVLDPSKPAGKSAQQLTEAS